MSIDHLLGDTCLIEPPAGHSATGPLFGPGVASRCRIEDAAELLRDNLGEQAPATARLFLPLGTPIAAGARVTIGGRVLTAVTVAVIPGRAGPHHVEVRLR
ncbi:hypothetical protein [Longispora albida]|uniref:hypothetical protein n=1 Tax=Longispora albida TaxID=203523 RepID=UPI000381F905|nr:hypothetical protein [Longispora albida]